MTATQPCAARLLATLGRELYYTDRGDDGERYAHEAVLIARGLGDPDLLGFALTNSWLASHLRLRSTSARDATRETLALVGHGLSARTELSARIHHLGELACQGDLTSFDIELSRCQHLAAELHSPELDAHVTWARCQRVLFDGRWDDAERLGLEAYDSMRRTSGPSNEWSYVAMQVAVARGRGRLAGVADQLQARCDEPEFKVFRPAVVLGHAHAERLTEAHELIDRWSEPVANDWTWMLATAYWAAVSTMLGAPDPQRIFDDLLPCSGEMAIAGLALDCGGSVDALLAGLCRRLGRIEEALRFARRGLRFETQSGMRAWVPRTTALVASLEDDLGGGVHDDASDRPTR